MHALDSTNYIIILSLTAFYFILKAPYYSCDSDITQFDNNYPATRNKSLIRESLEKPRKNYRNPQNRKIHNAAEREVRRRIAQSFVILRDSCSYLNSNRRIPSKVSILSAATKECKLLQIVEKRLVEEKKLFRKANGILKKRIKEMTK